MFKAKVLLTGMTVAEVIATIRATSRKIAREQIAIHYGDHLVNIARLWTIK